MLRLLLWRMLGLVAVLVGAALTAWFLSGGPGKALRGGRGDLDPSLAGFAHLLSELAGTIPGRLSLFGVGAKLVLAFSIALSGGLMLARMRSRARRSYVRLQVEPYRTDRASAESVVRMFEALHKRVLRRWWRRLLSGQPSIALELHHTGGAEASAWLAVACPEGLEPMVESALRAAYANCRVRPARHRLGSAPAVLRLKKRAEFIKRVKVLDHFEHEREPPVNRLMTVMAACSEPAYVQVAITPTPVLFERLARSAYKRHEARISRERREHAVVRDRSMVEDAELRGGLDVQHRPLFFVDLRVVAPTRRICEQIAAELRAEGAENHLVERGTTVRHGLLGLYRRRVLRGEGNPLPSFHKGVFASTELAALWQLPSIDYATVPFTRTGLPLAPAPPAILRPPAGEGTLRDSLGAVSIDVDLRKQNTAVPGAVETGKTSYLVATLVF